jgi:hypothetical protein
MEHVILRWLAALNLCLTLHRQLNLKGEEKKIFKSFGTE